MNQPDWKLRLNTFDERREIIVPGDAKETVNFCVDQFLQIGNQAIKSHGFFAVALSGGSTPNAIFKELVKPNHIKAIDWSKVLCFWSDERSVLPNDKESNYFNAMQAGIAQLPLLPDHIFRMHAEDNIEAHALAYEKLIRKHIPSLEMDLLMLGMGEDGHTASLFPHTEGLKPKGRLVIANEVPQKQTWRMSMTYECIDLAKNVCIYVIGASKAGTVAKVLAGPYDPADFPVQRVGTAKRKAIWILDKAAATLLQGI